MTLRFCPCCGKPILDLIESIPSQDEVKHILSCEDCELIVNVFESYFVTSTMES